MALIKFKSIIDKTEITADIMFFLHRIKELRELCEI